MLVRADLAPGTQATQATHAAFAFSLQHPRITRQWFADSSFLILLQARDEQHLRALADSITAPHVRVYEPDLDDALTAVAIAPGDHTRRLRSLPLLLREEVAMQR